MSSEGIPSLVNSVAVSSDNRHVVSGSEDNTVRIWNVLTGEEEHILRGHSEVYSVAVSPDNHHIVSGSWDNTVRIWNVSTSDEGLPLVISFVFSSDNCQVMSGLQVNTIPIGEVFLSSMVTSIALLAQGDNITSIPVIQRFVSGESLPLGVLLGAICRGLSCGTHHAYS
jgi:WD40 repeat protein